MKQQAKELIWNYASIVIMAISGLLMTIVIAYFYDSSSLGIFNESYAWYMALSQVSTWGIHMAVLKYVPENSYKKDRESILKSAISSVLLISLLVMIVAEVVLSPLTSIAWRESLQIALLGIPFFSLNKVLLHYLNAICELIVYAWFQSLRYVLLFCILLFGAVASCPSVFLTMVFPIAESLVLVSVLWYLKKHKGIRKWIGIRDIRELMTFGMKILPSNMVVEISTKIDVICLGFLMQNTSEIGVYSFAALFAEGFYMIFYTIRRLINPGIAESNAKSMLKVYVQKVRKTIDTYMIIGTISGLVAVMAVYYMLCHMLKGAEYTIGIVYIAIICTAIAVNGKSIIWGDFLSQTGFPAEESKVNLLSVVGNCVFNVGLIPFWGTIGAAIATGISHFIYGVGQKKYIRSRLGIEI